MNMARDLHVAMVPWLAFGHMIPFLQLSISLAKSGIRVSFISTSRNIQRLPKVPPNLESLINLVELHLPTVEGLPQDAEATVDLSMDQIQYLKVAYDLLQHQFKQFVADESPDWIIHDYAPYWTAEIAREFGIQQIMFSVFSAALLSFFGPLEYLITGERQREIWSSSESMTSPPEWITIPSSVAYRLHEARDMFPGVFGQNASGVTDADRIALTLGASQAVAIRSCKEYEGDYLNLTEKIYRKPVIPVGLLPPVHVPKHEVREERERKIFKWLDEQREKSVVYVGFGSEVKLSRDQVYEIARGLELAHFPFIWALRKPMWVSNDDDALPSDFRKQTAHQGIVVMGWAPQLDILAHPSIGGSLFHSGWGSIIETLQHGHALVVLPLVIDQGLNARLLVEKGLAVEVERSEDGSFNGTDIAKALKKAMVEEEGESLRIKAREMGSVFMDEKLHYSYYMDGFVKFLRNRNSTAQCSKESSA